MKMLVIPSPQDVDFDRPAANYSQSDDWFQGGPPLGEFSKTELEKYAIRYAVLAALVAWLPLAILAGAQTLFLNDGSLQSFIADYGVHARALVAAPLLVLAEGITAQRLSAIARHFRDTGLVREKDSVRFQGIMESTRRWRDWWGAKFILSLCVLALALASAAEPLRLLPTWHRFGANPASLSIAGIWHQLVSIPILLLLVLGWTWRLFLWARFLWLVSRLDLHLIPSHPDRTAGLQFVGLSLQSLSLVGCALGTILAGSIANRVLHDGVSVLTFRQPVLGFVLLLCVLLVGPLLFFSGKLLAAMRRGAFEYGAMARAMGRQLEQRWLGRDLDATALDANDFSAATDLYSIVANVYTMNIVPVSLKNLGLVVTMSLLPFLPVALTAISPAELLQKIGGFFL